jgi:hypothetical protein
MEQIDELKTRYAAACHAMQSGVAAMMHWEVEHTDTNPMSHAHSPKHLRVGVNSALVDSAALGMLLVKKGVITELEYYTAITEGMETEVRKYEKELSECYGRTVNLA